MEKYAEYIDAWAKREKALQRQVARKAKEIKSALPAISQKLKSFGAQEVIIFGSYAKGEFTAGSDLDIAAKKLPEGKYLHAIIAVEKLLKSVQIGFDLILYERAYPWVKEQIDQGRNI